MPAKPSCLKIIIKKIKIFHSVSRVKWAQFSIKFCRNILFLYFTLTPLNTFIILVLVLYFNVNFYVKMCFWRSKWKKWKTDFFWKLTHFESFSKDLFERWSLLDAWYFLLNAIVRTFWGLEEFLFGEGESSLLFILYC